MSAKKEVVMEVTELVSRCIAGENPAWDEFVKQYKAFVIRNVLHRLYMIGANSFRAEA